MLKYIDDARAPQVFSRLHNPMSTPIASAGGEADGQIASADDSAAIAAV